MGIKDLFNSKGVGSVISNKSLSDLTSTYGLESVGVISASFDNFDILLPNIDFTNPSSFAKYGSAEKYYEDAITKIANTYPFDGSKKQKLEWRNNASYLDLYLFDYEYPRHTGSITIGTTFGTSTVLSNGYYNTPTRTEYIKINTGLQTGSRYSDLLDRKSSFSFNSEDGFCIEFYLKSDTWSADLATASFQTILHAGANSNDTTSSIAFVDNGWQFLVHTTGTSLIFGIDDVGGDHYTTLANAFSFGQWNRFSINVLSGGNVEIWKNGIRSAIGTALPWPYLPCDIRLSGSIGSYSGFPGSYWTNQGAQLGWMKFSGSLDDFRFWRKSRTDKEISENWFNSVDGGFDEDELLNPLMGFYYKFNESTVNTASYDARVLDYSGRKNNATWIGYVSGSRIDYSPIVNEFRDPILHLSSSIVNTLLYSKTLIGREYDLQNNGAFLNQLPNFLIDEDENDHWENLSQIIASMFDRFWIQINSLTSLKDTNYFNSGSFSSEILVKAINSNGLSISNILDDYTLRELILDKSDTFSLENSIESIKQVIYKNIYNNLIYILKSKGTEKSIKSVFRTFGVDDDVLKIHAYAKESEIEIDGAKRINVIRRKNLLDLSGYTDSQNMISTLFNHYIPEETASIGYFTASNIYENRRTIESTIIFPKKFNSYDPNYVKIPNNSLSASLFGCNQVADSIAETSTDATFASNAYGFTVYSVQKSLDSKDAKFVFIYSKNKSSQIYTETNWIKDVYDNSKWTFGVRLCISGTNNLDNVEDGNVRGIITSSLNFFGINELGGNLIHSFSFFTDFEETTNNNLFMAKTKLFVGAERTNFTGNLLYPTQAKFAYLRMWQAYLSDDDIVSHALDSHNYGIHSSSWNYSAEQSVYSANAGYSYSNYMPRAETLMLNWDFENNYTPNSSGIFTVSSFRANSIYSGSYIDVNIPLGSCYSAIGYGFNSGSTVIDKNYIIEQKNRIPTDFYSSDTISLIDDSEMFFGRKIKPVEYFYTIENSIYNVISEEILNLFSSINEFNNLFGIPHDRYKIEYKNMKVMRQLFFSKVRNTKIDVEKYLSYYRWLDDSISEIISKLLPISANADSKIRNMIESHVLERNKHLWHSELIAESSRPEHRIQGSIRSLFKRNILLQGR